MWNIQLLIICFIYNINSSTSTTRKKTLMTIFEKYLNICKSKIEMQIVNFTMVEKLIPSIFYSDQFITKLNNTIYD